ncbi:unnamed protein product, partial [Urochloa humidicola]
VYTVEEPLESEEGRGDFAADATAAAGRRPSPRSLLSKILTGLISKIPAGRRPSPTPPPLRVRVASSPYTRGGDCGLLQEGTQAAGHRRQALSPRRRAGQELSPITEMAGDSTSSSSIRHRGTKPLLIMCPDCKIDGWLSSSRRSHGQKGKFSTPARITGVGSRCPFWHWELSWHW